MGTETMHSPIPLALDNDLRKMRRNPADFAVSSVNKCKFCLKPKTAYHLINAKFGTRIVGSWCLTHGWLFFDSVELPPTERLKPTEIEEIRLTDQRRKEFARRKAALQS